MVITEAVFFSRKMFACLLIALFLFGCGGGGGGTSSTTRTTALESTSQIITAAQGGTIALPGGSSVTIPAGALASDQTVRLSLVSSFPKEPPSGSLTSVGHALVLDFDSKQTAFPQAGDLTFVIRYGATLPERFTGSAPLVNVVASDNFFGGVPISCESSSACFVIPLSTIQNAQSISAASVNLSTEITFAPPPRFGPRIWNGSVWLDYPQGFDPNKKTLVLTHGILSTVEDSFGGSVSELMSQGGYTQVIGFNYDYARNNMVEAGQKFADFLNSLQTEGGLTQIDLQAHSFGTLVALYAASQTDLAINNMILLGGPLDGTPAADLAGPGLLTLLANYAPDNPYATTTTFAEALESGMFLDAQPGNPLLKTIRTNAINRHPNTNYIKIFGSKSMWGSIVTGFLFDTAPNDGMVPASESVGDDLPGPTYIVSEEHDKLQSNSDVQQFVGANLISALPPITGDVTGYWTGTINNPNLGIYGCNGGLSYFSISLSEDAGSISGSYGSVSVSGNRSEYALSINADTSFGNRSYSWTWDGGDTLTGSVAYYCWSDDTGALLKEGSGTFTVTR